MRRSLRSALLALVLAIFASALVSAPAIAKHPKTRSISGRILLHLADNTTQPPVQQGAITVTPARARVTFRGDIRGPAVEPYTNVLMPDGGPTLQFSRGAVFTGKILGRRGTLTYDFSGDAQYGGLITFVSGTGRLAGATGRIAYFPMGKSTADPLTFGYEGQIRFAE